MAFDINSGSAISVLPVKPVEVNLTANKRFKCSPGSTIQFYAFLVFLFLTWNGYSADTTSGAADLVTFFKQAITSPPDVEKFAAKRANLNLPAGLNATVSLSDTNALAPGSVSFQCYEGALAGTNYYLRTLLDPTEPSDTNHLGLVEARAGAAIYEIGGSGLIRSSGTNGSTASVDVHFRSVREILCMGVETIEPGTVNWSGNEFTAKNILGKELHGSLQISNNLPFRMELRLGQESQPYTAIEYAYPNPADALAGYPAKMAEYYRFKNGLEPLAEIEIKSVLLATQRLNADFFSETRFARFITFTNVYSNSDLYAVDAKNGNLVKLNPSPVSRRVTPSKPHQPKQIPLTIVIALPAGLLLIWAIRKPKTKK